MGVAAAAIFGNPAAHGLQQTPIWDLGAIPREGIPPEPTCGWQLLCKPASSGEAKGCGREEIQHAGWAQGKGILAAGIANAELRHSA
jgi:hypothetical protein